MDDSMLEEFKLEAFELLEESEESLLSLETNGDFEQCYNSIFRCFHSLKGGTGMFGLEELQGFMHKVENLIDKKRDKNLFDEKLISFLLNTMDQVKSYLEGGSYNFVFEYDESEKAEEAHEENIIKFHEKKEHYQEQIQYDGLIYIVDDEKDMLELLQMTFEEETNLKVETFNDPELALEAFKNKNPDLVLTDLSMPEMSGVELIRELAAINQLVPVIILSGFVTKDSCMDALRFGASGILEKPCDMQLLLDQSNHAIRRYQSFKLLNKSIDLLTYQFEEFDSFLGNKGDQVRKQFRSELKNILKRKKELYKKSA